MTELATLELQDIKKFVLDNYTRNGLWVPLPPHTEYLLLHRLPPTSLDYRFLLHTDTNKIATHDTAFNRNFTLYSANLKELLTGELMVVSTSFKIDRYIDYLPNTTPRSYK